MFSFETNPAASEPQRLILFFDNQSLKPADQVRARRAAASFIDAHSGENHLMAIADFDGALRVAQNFTDNPGRLKDAVNGTHYSGINAGGVTPTGAVNTAASSASINDQNTRGLMGVIANLARNLGAVPGRKIIVVLSAGLPPSSEANHEIEAAVQACNRSNTGVYTIDLSEPMSLDGINIDTSLSNATPQRPGIMRTNVGRGPQPAPTNEPVDTRALSALAQGSGGFVFHNTNDLLRGLQEIGEEQSAYYVLGYTPPESKEGSCHNLRVKVDRSGLTVRARSSYCSTKAQDLLAGSSAAKDLELRAAAAASGNVSASIQLPFFYLSPTVARVRVAMEIIPEALKFESKNGKQRAELNVLGIATVTGGTAADGDTAARFSDVVKLDVDDRRAPVRYEKEFKIAPGQYKFTVVFSSGGAGFGKLETPLVIEPHDPASVALSAITFSKDVHAVPDLGLDAGLFEDTVPLIAGGVEFVPAASNQFRKGERAVFYIELSPPPTGDLGIRMQILDRKSGVPTTDSGFMKVDRPAGKPPTAAIPLGQNLPTANLAPGSYTVDLTAVDAQGRLFRRTANFELR
jgi:VWFA-related protein